MCPNWVNGGSFKAFSSCGWFMWYLNMCRPRFCIVDLLQVYQTFRRVLRPQKMVSRPLGGWNFIGKCVQRDQLYLKVIIKLISNLIFYFQNYFGSFLHPLARITYPTTKGTLHMARLILVWLIFIKFYEIHPLLKFYNININLMLHFLGSVIKLFNSKSVFVLSRQS